MARSLVFLISHSAAGGVQEIWMNLAEGFRIQGFSVTLMALYPFDTSTSANNHWRFVASQRPRTIIDRLLLLRNLIRFFQASPPSVVFTAMPAANVLTSLAVGLAGAPTRVIMSHHVPVEANSKVLNLLDSALGCLSHVHAIVSVSDTVSSSLDSRPRIYRRKRRTIRNALPPDVEVQLAELARHRNTCLRVRRVVAAGRLASQKNYPVLLRAAAHLPDVQVDIVGGGPDEASLKGLARDLNVQDRVKFWGHLPRDKALELLAAADVFVQPSLFEGHSLALIEAAKLKLPLVVSNIPVQIEGITSFDHLQCGIIVDPHDDRGLARAIQHLLDDPSYYATWSKRSEHLAHGQTFDALMRAYRELANYPLSTPVRW